MRLLVVGAGGHLGRFVGRGAVERGWEVVGTYRRTPGSDPALRWLPLDIRSPATVDSLMRTVRPDVVVNVAYDRDDWLSTADGAAHVAVASATVDARLVHVSSDVVHGGRTQPYGDDEPPSPVHTYGAAKAAAETAVRAADPGAAVVRTSLIVGDETSSQVRFCLDLLRGAPGALFADEVRGPVAVEDLAAALIELAAGDYAGLLNVTGPELVTRVEFAALVARRYGLDPTRVAVSTIAAAGLVRPAHIELDCTRAGELLTTRLRGVSEVLAAS